MVWGLGRITGQTLRDQNWLRNYTVRDNTVHHPVSAPQRHSLQLEAISWVGGHADGLSQAAVQSQNILPSYSLCSQQPIKPWSKSSLKEKREHCPSRRLALLFPTPSPGSGKWGGEPLAGGQQPLLHGCLLGGMNGEQVSILHTWASLPLWTYELSLTSRRKGPHLLAAGWLRTCALGWLFIVGSPFKTVVRSRRRENLVWTQVQAKLSTPSGVKQLMGGLLS